MYSLYQWLEWSEWRDLNPRPLVPQTSALTGLRYTPMLALIEKAPFGCNAVWKIANGGGRAELLALRRVQNACAFSKFRQGRAQPFNIFSGQAGRPAHVFSPLVGRLGSIRDNS